ncbi:primosomal replication protein [Photobacterium sp. BZF1]|uniref:primosomal replication protein n=1 Tax=Photobacterium TaxID=657 RepID=UPI001653A3BE|nr:primosomal replication protein [Photobacterium rosenbergii]MBC7004766.1 primosomal replication protein [Photobacterium sp. BZF1]MBY5949052.1 primosomal replication protein [Photobacterium rosenbergii]
MLDFQRLEDIATQLAHEAASTDRKRGEAPRPLFDEQLFHCRSKLLVPCVNEIRDEIRALNREHKAGKLHPSRTQHVCERIVSQIQAVQRELATQQIRKNEPKRSAGWRKPIHELYQDLAQHQDWERRLAAMQRDKELMIARCTTLAEQQKMQKEVLALEGRLARCRTALAKIEKDISLRERKG